MTIGKDRKKSKIDDGFHSELADGALLEGYMGIPKLMRTGNPDPPKRIVPFDKLESEVSKGNTSGYVGFYLMDDKFEEVIVDFESWLPILKKFDGVITPDCTLMKGQSNCLQAANTYFNRAVGFALQKNHVAVIPQIRWGDKSTYEYCFLGVEKNCTVAISTYGCIKGNDLEEDFRNGLSELIKRLSPQRVLVHGAMPPRTFDDFISKADFVHYDNWTKVMHETRGAGNGIPR